MIADTFLKVFIFKQSYRYELQPFEPLYGRCIPEIQIHGKRTYKRRCSKKHGLIINGAHFRLLYTDR